MSERNIGSRRHIRWWRIFCFLLSRQLKNQTSTFAALGCPPVCEWCEGLSNIKKFSAQNAITTQYEMEMGWIIYELGYGSSLYSSSRSLLSAKQFVVRESQEELVPWPELITLLCSFPWTIESGFVAASLAPFLISCLDWQAEPRSLGWNEKDKDGNEIQSCSLKMSL